jgi:two-component system sensor histidine kinase ChiS
MFQLKDRQGKETTFTYISLALVFAIALLIGIAPLLESVFIKPAAHPGHPGYIDLSGASNPSRISLAGDWLAVWGELLEPSQVPSRLSAAHPFAIPGTWSQLRENNGHKYPENGVATFHVSVDLPPQGVDAISLRYVFSAYRLYVNGQEVASNGVVSQDRRLYRAQWLPQTRQLKRIYGRADITLQVANYTDPVGGMIKTVYLGRYEGLYARDFILQLINAILLGCCFMMAIYHATIFAVGRNAISNLFLSLLCLVSCARVICTGQLIEQLFPNHWVYTLVMRVTFSSFYLAIPIFGYCVATTFKDSIPRWVLRGILGVSLAFESLVIFAPAPVFQKTFYPFSLISLVCFIYYCMVLRRLIVARQPRAWPITIGFALVLATALNDITAFSYMIQPSFYDRDFYFAPVGFTVFLFIQTALHSINYMELYYERDSLSKKLTAQREQLRETVRKRTAKLARANHRLKKIDEEKTNFYASVSHELKTPLANIRLCVDSIADGRMGESVPASAQVFSVISRQTNRLSRQVSSMLAFSRLELNRMYPNLRPRDLAETLEVIVAGLKPCAELKGLRLEFVNRADESLTVNLDQALFETVINNLVDNAIKFTRVKSSVWVILEREGDQAVVKVEDQGPGISAANLPYIFDRFYSVDPDESTYNETGTGIGLSLVRGIVKAHGGDVEACNREEGGARFSVRLPLERDVRPESAPVKAKPSTQEIASLMNLSQASASAHEGFGVPLAAVSSVTGKKRHILIVEDNEVLLTSLAGAMGRHFEVSVAHDGIEGLERLRAEGDIDLVISDIMMPRMDGVEFFRRAREEFRAEPMPFVFLTARSLPEEKALLLGSGAVGYVTKPFSVNELEAKAAGLIDFVEREKSFLRNSLMSHFSGWAGEVLGQARAVPEIPAAQASPAPRKRSVAEAAQVFGLTSRQIEIIELIVRGEKDADIATRLKLSPKTVSDHVRNILEKTGAGNRTELAYMMLSQGDE